MDLSMNRSNETDPVFFNTEAHLDDRAEGVTIEPPISVQVCHISPDQPEVQSLFHPPAPAEATIQVSLTHSPLSVVTASKFISSPAAGANVLFTGTTRNTFAARTVTRLEYSAYPALALRTMLSLCQAVQSRFQLEKVYLIHRLGVVTVGEESIIVGVSSAHRKAGWEGAEELLELVKSKVEVWKREWFLDGGIVEGKDGEVGKEVNLSASSKPAVRREKEVGQWRANADTDSSGNVVRETSP